MRSRYSDPDTDPSGRWLRTPLHDLAETHEPDRDRMVARMGDISSPARSSMRRGRAFLLVAGATTAVVGVAAGAGFAFRSPSHGDRAPMASQSIISSPGGGVVTGLPSSSGPVTPDSPTPSVTVLTLPSPTIGAGSTSAPRVSVNSAAPGTGTSVMFPQSADRDWIIFGAGGSPLSSVRSATPIGHPLGSLQQLSGTASLLADNTVSLGWSGGSPLPSGQGWTGRVFSPIWGHQRLTATAGPTPHTIVLYVSTNGADALLQAWLSVTQQVPSTQPPHDSGSSSSDGSDGSGEGSGSSPAPSSSRSPSTQIVPQPVMTTTLHGDQGGTRYYQVSISFHAAVSTPLVIDLTAATSPSTAPQGSGWAVAAAELR